MDDLIFQYHSPGYVVLMLLPLPLLIFDLYKLKIIKFPISSTLVLKDAKKSWRTYFEFVPPLLRFVALILLIFALARPQWGNKYTEVESEGVDIVLALDTSGSMRALDLELEGDEADRLQVVKAVVKDFIEGRDYDRIGMVVFGSEAYTQCPLTLDYDILEGYLDLIEIGIAGEETAIGNAIATSVKRLIQSDTKSKIIILLTDGMNTSGAVSPIKAAETAKKHNIKIYTIAVGSKGRVPYPKKGLFGYTKVWVELPVDEKTLKEVAQITDGQFFKASDTETLTNIYKTIDKLEKTEVKRNEFFEFQETYMSFLMPAIGLLLAAWFLQRTVFLRLP